MVKENNKSKMKSWLFPLTIAVILWGIAAFLRKKAVFFLPPQSALTFEIFGGVLMVIIILALTGGQLVREPRGAFFGVLTGLLAVGGTFFIFRALKEGPVSIITSFTALAIVITVVLGVTVLHEKLLPHHIAGIAMGIAAAILLSF